MNRILLQLDHDENRRLLAEWLGTHYRVVPDGTDALLNAAFDLCILDARALSRLWRQVEQRKSRERPLFLPFLVVISRQHGHLMTGELRQCVDELIASPVEKMELVLRLNNLLRIRRQSLELEAANVRLKRNLQQMEEDEEGGRHIQFQLLPEKDKRFGRYAFSRELITSAYLSGDFVDYFVIDERHLGFYMADVSGHGVSSAFVTVLLKSHMSRLLDDYREHRSDFILCPARLLDQLNRRILCGHLGKYLTIFYGVLDQGANRLRYGQGGQFPFPILYDGNETRFVGDKSLPVGLFDFAEYRSVELDLPPRFVLTMISDGILEVLPQARLRDKLGFLLSLVHDQGISVDRLVRTLALHRGQSLPDDVTFLMLRGGG